MKKSFFIPFVNTSVAEDICFTLLLVPLWWYIGINFIVFHFLSVFLFIKTVVKIRRASERLQPPKEILFLSAYIFIYILSILINLKDIPVWRLLASLNNLSYWVMGVIILFVVYNSIKLEDITKYLRTFKNFGIITAVFVISIFSGALISLKYMNIETLIYQLLPRETIELIKTHAPLLRSHLIPHLLIKSDFFSIPDVPRPNGFNLWATTLSGTMILLIVMTLAFYKNRKRRIESVVVLGVEFITLFVTLSRNILCLFISLIIICLLTQSRKKMLLNVTTLVLVVVVLFTLLIPPDELVNSLKSVRKYSTQSRFELYELAFSNIKQKPILGYGYKPRLEELSYYPIGSHSTYIGILHKTGLLGLVVFFLFWGSVLRKWWIQRRIQNEVDDFRTVWFFTGVAMVSGLLWMVGEDLDTSPIFSFIYFVIIGIIISLRKCKKTEPQ